MDVCFSIARTKGLRCHTGVRLTTHHLLIMGLFDFWKPAKTPQQKALDDVLTELLPRVFPGGQAEINFRAAKVVEICNGKLTHSIAAFVYAKAKTRVWLASRGFDGEAHLGVKASELVQLTQSDSGGKLSSFESASVVFYAIYDKIDPTLNAETAVENWSMTCFGSDDLGVDADEVLQGIGEFGFDPTNPVPVRGILSNDIYLDRLRTSDGRAIQYKRLRSLTVSNVFGNIDEYELSQEGRTLCKLYLSPYNRKISSRPPEGFLIIKRSAK